MIELATTYGFEFIRNTAMVDANPRSYTLKTGESFKRGDLVTVDANGNITKANDTTKDNVVGVMATSISSAKAGEKGPVYDEPGNIYRVSYTGADVTANTVGIGLKNSRLVDTAVVDGPLAVHAIDTNKKTMDVSIVKRLFN